MFEIDDSNLDGFGGVTAGVQVEERWQYPGVGYNAQEGKFYIGEDEAKTLEIIPFALRQCKEVIDAYGTVHRYPIKTRRTDMVEGEPQARVQVVGLVNGELHVFGARSWTARAAWVNPLSGPYRDEHFEGGLWPRLAHYIKEVRIRRGIVTAPLCYRLSLAVGDAISVSSAANAKQKSKTFPIAATGVVFVGAQQAEANARLYIEEQLDEWVSEWNSGAAAVPVDDIGNDDAPPATAMMPANGHTTEIEIDPLAPAVLALPNSSLAFRNAADATRFIVALTANTRRNDNRILEAADKLINARADGMTGQDAANAAIAWYKQPAPAPAQDDLFGDAEYDARQEAAKAALVTAMGKAN